jgi:hypothetical protein
VIAGLPNVIERPAEPNLWRYGKILDEEIATYHACGALSRTKLEVFRTSPLLFWKTFIAKTIPKDPPGEALIVGQAVDALSLEGPEAFAERFIALPDGAPRRPNSRQLNAKKQGKSTLEAIMFYEAFDEQAKGKTALDTDQLELVKRCADALHGNEVFKKLMVGGTSQVTFRVKGDRISLQCRPDRWCEDGNEFTDGMPCILDVKTIQELPADQGLELEDHLPKHIAKFGYHRGAWLYPEIVANVEKYKDGFRPQFILCFVEKQEPFAVTCRPVSQLAIEVAEREVRDLLHKMLRCIERNHWPEWWNDPMKDVGLPEYYMRRSLADTNLW